MPGQAEVVVRAEVQDGTVAPLHPDLGPLGPEDRPLLLEEALLADLLELGGKELAESGVHGKASPAILGGAAAARQASR